MASEMTKRFHICYLIWSLLELWEIRMTLIVHPIYQTRRLLEGRWHFVVCGDVLTRDCQWQNPSRWLHLPLEHVEEEWEAEGSLPDGWWRSLQNSGWGRQSQRPWLEAWAGHPIIQDSLLMGTSAQPGHMGEGPPGKMKLTMTFMEPMA